MKRITLSSAKKKAWVQFSRYIRLVNADQNGNVRCYTCSTTKPWKEMQAGHGIPGRNNAVLFLEEIVKPQCVGCNMFANGRLAVFTRKLIDELGMEEYDTVSRLSNDVVKYTIFDFQELERWYKEQVEGL